MPSSSSSSALESDVERRLQALHIDVALASLDDGQRFALIGNLLRAYDPTWQLEGVPNLIGKNARGRSKSEAEGSGGGGGGASSDEAEPGDGEAPFWLDKDNIKSLKRWLIQAGVGHLATQRVKLSEGGPKFLKLVGGLLEKAETTLGSKLTSNVRQILQKQNRASLPRRLSSVSRLSTKPGEVTGAKVPQGGGSGGGSGGGGDSGPNEQVAGDDDCFAKPAKVQAKKKTRKKAAAKAKNKENTSEEEEEEEDLSKRVPPSQGRQLERTPLKATNDGAEAAAAPDTSYGGSFTPPRLVVRTTPRHERSGGKGEDDRNAIDPPRELVLSEEEEEMPVNPTEEDADGPSADQEEEGKADADATGSSEDTFKIPTGRQLPRTPANPEGVEGTNGQALKLPKGEYVISEEKSQLADETSSKQTSSKQPADTSVKKRKRESAEKPKMVLEVPHDGSRVDVPRIAVDENHDDPNEEEESGAVQEAEIDSTASKRKNAKPVKKLKAAANGPVFKIRNMSRNRSSLTPRRPPATRKRPVEGAKVVVSSQGDSGNGEPSKKPKASTGKGQAKGTKKTSSNLDQTYEVEESKQTAQNGGNSETDVAAMDESEDQVDKVFKAAHAKTATQPTQKETKKKFKLAKKAKDSDEKGAPVANPPGEDMDELIQVSKNISKEDSQDGVLKKRKAKTTPQQSRRTKTVKPVKSESSSPSKNADVEPEAVANGPETTQSTEKAPRKGRPRKKATEHVSTPDAGLDVVSSPSESVKVKSTKSTDTSKQAESTLSSEKAPRKGRPRKKETATLSKTSDEASHMISSPQSEVSAKEGKGKKKMRSAQQETAATPTTAEKPSEPEAVQESSAKKRGRPKKKPTIEPIKLENVETSPAKRKGRSSKKETSTPSEDAPEADESSVVKTPAAETAPEQVKPNGSSAKKRGRTRKAEAPSSDSKKPDASPTKRLKMASPVPVVAATAAESSTASAKSKAKVKASTKAVQAEVAKKKARSTKSKKADETIVEQNLDKMDVPASAVIKLSGDVYKTPQVSAPPAPKRGRPKKAATAVSHEVEDAVYATPAAEASGGSKAGQGGKRKAKKVPDQKTKETGVDEATTVKRSRKAKAKKSES